MSKKLTVRQAAAILGITTGLVTRYIKHGRLLAEKETVRTTKGRKGFLIERSVLIEFRNTPRKSGPKPQLTA
jgi:predicted transcriptional regulator